jgi:hypothetical protein
VKKLLNILKPEDRECGSDKELEKFENSVFKRNGE